MKNFKTEQTITPCYLCGFSDSELFEFDFELAERISTDDGREFRAIKDDDGFWQLQERQQVANKPWGNLYGELFSDDELQDEGVDINDENEIGLFLNLRAVSKFGWYESIKNDDMRIEDMDTLTDTNNHAPIKVAEDAIVIIVKGGRVESVCSNLGNANVIIVDCDAQNDQGFEIDEPAIDSLDCAWEYIIAQPTFSDQMEQLFADSETLKPEWIEVISCAFDAFDDTTKDGYFPENELVLLPFAEFPKIHECFPNSDCDQIAVRFTSEDNQPQSGQVSVFASYDGEVDDLPVWSWNYAK